MKEKEKGMEVPVIPETNQVSLSAATPLVAAPQPQPKGSVPWKRISRGVPVEPGLNWITGLTHEQRVAHMYKHEQFWKQQYNSQRGSVALQQNWTRG